MTEKRFNRKLEKIKKRGERYKKEKELKEAYAEYVPERKKRRFSSIMILIIIISIVAFTIASFMLQYYTGNEISSTLTTCFYAFWTTEVVALTGIKVSKVRKNVDASNDESACG